MYKKILSLLVIAISAMNLSGCNDKYSNEELEYCVDLIWTSLTTAYNFYGDYSKLPGEYKNAISEDIFDILNYRVDESEGFGILGTDYYEKNFINKPKAYIEEDTIRVDISYGYGCYSYSNNAVLYYTSCDEIPLSILFEKENDEYIVKDIKGGY